MNKLCKDASVSISDYDRHFTEQEIYDINRISKIRSDIMTSVINRANTNNISYIAKDKGLPPYELNLLLETKRQLGLLGTGKKEEGEKEYEYEGKKNKRFPKKKQKKNTQKSKEMIEEDEDYSEEDEDLKELYDEDTWKAKYLRKFIYEKILCEIYSKQLLDIILSKINP